LVIFSSSSLFSRSLLYLSLFSFIYYLFRPGLRKSNKTKLICQSINLSLVSRYFRSINQSVSLFRILGLWSFFCSSLDLSIRLISLLSLSSGGSFRGSWGSGPLSHYVRGEKSCESGAPFDDVERLTARAFTEVRRAFET
jgi:hypothetical protein